MFLVKGPENKQVVGYVRSRKRAKEIARELNGMLDDFEETGGDVGDNLYYTQEVKSASRHLENCREMGFPF